MLKKFITAKASRDIAAIRSYTRHHFGADQAEKHTKELRLRIEQLRRQPDIGQNRAQELGHNIHSYFIGSHTIYYTFNDETIVILTVLHQNMLPQKHLLPKNSSPTVRRYP